MSTISRVFMVGIIPADAGSTLAQHAGDPKGPGSSPRMRGAQTIMKTITAVKRIIPADAGSTEKRRDELIVQADHPRGCGEHFLWTVYVSPRNGSSPRMRGALNHRLTGLVDVRIIPADAGSTRHRLQCSSRAQDHPRGCGEHEKVAVSLIVA